MPEDANAQAPQGAGAEPEALTLDKVVEETEQYGGSRDLVETLVQKASELGISYDKNVTRTVNKAIDLIDAALSRQLAEIMHHPDFQRLEGTWRGLHYLLRNTTTSKQLQIKVLNGTKGELLKDLEKAEEVDQSELFKKIYTNEYGMPGGQPYGALIGDYYFGHKSEDIDLLQKVSEVGAHAFCPFISGASHEAFGFRNDFTELAKLRDVEQIFTQRGYERWNSLRDKEESRFTTLVMPRVLARLPYGKDGKPVEEFKYEELELDEKGRAKKAPHNHYTWMNAAYVMGARLTQAFQETGWCTRIRGAEFGGKVADLPCHTFITDEGDPDLKCPTEIGIPDTREAELSKEGFLSLGHYKNTDYAVFFGAQTLQRPKKYDTNAATRNAALSARLPYIMAVSRISHYLKVMARDWIGSPSDVPKCEKDLNRFLQRYVLSDDNPTPDKIAQFPLREAKVHVTEDPENPGAFRAIAWLRPFLQMEELTASMRLVAEIPKKLPK